MWNEGDPEALARTFIRDQQSTIEQLGKKMVLNFVNAIAAASAHSVIIDLGGRQHAACS